MPTFDPNYITICNARKGSIKYFSLPSYTYFVPQEQAASGIVYCAAHPSAENISGLYWYECWPAEPSDEAQDPTSAAALWELSEQIIAEKMANETW